MFKKIEENEELLKALSVLSESTRTEILFTIASEGELRAKDVLKKFDITQPTLSHHLNFLLENEIIRSRKEGRCVWYSVNKEMMLELSDLLKKLADPKTAAKIEKAPEQPDTWAGPLQTIYRNLGEKEKAAELDAYTK